MLPLVLSQLAKQQPLNQLLFFYVAQQISCNPFYKADLQRESNIHQHPTLEKAIDISLPHQQYPQTKRGFQVFAEQLKPQRNPGQKVRSDCKSVQYAC